MSRSLLSRSNPQMRKGDQSIPDFFAQASRSALASCCQSCLGSAAGAGAFFGNGAVARFGEGIGWDAIGAVVVTGGAATGAGLSIVASGLACSESTAGAGATTGTSTTSGNCSGAAGVATGDAGAGVLGGTWLFFPSKK